MLIAIVIATTRRKVVYAYVIVIDNAMLVKTRTLNIAVLFYYSFPPQMLMRKSDSK